MKKQVIISAQINHKVKKLADDWCKTNGLIMSQFLEDAILDKLEEWQDLKELEKLRMDSARPFRDVMKELV